MNLPTIGRLVYYRTDGRNGLDYDLPAIVVTTEDTHPGDYPDGSQNPLPIPMGNQVHLAVATPGGFGTKVTGVAEPESEDFVGALTFLPGAGGYVELNVPHAGEAYDGVSASVNDPAHKNVPARSWRWPLAQSK